MMLVLYLYPHIVSSLVVDSGGLQKNELLSIATNGDSLDAIGAFFKWVATSCVLIFGLTKSGAWAKEILGA